MAFIRKLVKNALPYYFVKKYQDKRERKIITKDNSMLLRCEMIQALAKYPFFLDKINLLKSYFYSIPYGSWSSNSNLEKESVSNIDTIKGYSKIHYGCGDTMIKGWLNVDIGEKELDGYKKVDLLNKHPFLDNSVHFGFSEDMLEHFSQCDAIFFLCEVYRTLIPGGVLRLSTPGLEGVLQRHYSPPSEKRINEGEFEAYHFWDHIHFYSNSELFLVAKHIGYKEVNFIEYGQSKYSELCNLDHRHEQRDLNIYVELVK